MDYALVIETAVGDSMKLVSGMIHPMLLPIMAIRVAELSEFIPGLRLVTMNHTMTELVFQRGNCRLRGEPVHWHELSKEG